MYAARGSRERATGRAGLARPRPQASSPVTAPGPQSPGAGLGSCTDKAPLAGPVWCGGLDRVCCEVLPRQGFPVVCKATATSPQRSSETGRTFWPMFIIRGKQCPREMKS